MNKYFIEYPKNHIYVRFDGLDRFVNFKFKHDDNEYLFVKFVCRNSWFFSAFKRAKVLCTACDMPPLVPFSNINNMSTSVNNSNFTFVNFYIGVHASPGTDKKLHGSSLYWIKHTFIKFSNTSTSNAVSNCR